MSIVSVIIPAYNESDIIQDTIRALIDIQCINQIIVVDDGSTDKTYEIAEDNGAEVIRFTSNRGKGKALETGIHFCVGDIIVFLDADVGKSAVEILKLIKSVENGQCDVAIASFGKAKKNGGLGLVKFVSRYGAKVLTGIYVKSILSGQRAFRAEVFNNITIGTGYGAEVGMTIDIIKKRFKIMECEVDMYHRETGRDLNGFIHRGKQFCDIIKVLICKGTKQVIRRNR